MEKLTIGVDVRPLAFPGTGNARYLAHMLEELMRQRPDWDWIFLSNRGVHPVYAELVQKSSVQLEVDGDGWNKYGPYWIHRRLPQVLRELQPTIFWGTLAMLPYNYRKRVPLPAVVNFHDLNAFVQPKTMVRWNRWQHRLLDEHTIENASQIMCLSKTTGHDILRILPRADARRLVVVYPGCEIPRVEPKRPDAPVGDLKDFILCVGTIEPRKNHRTLIDAYIQARAADRELPPLVLCGGPGWGRASERLFERLKSGRDQKNGIYFLASPPDSELRWCYQNASMLANPSLHEGFGLPVLEAQFLGLPTLISDIPVFREIGGDARFAPVKDIEAWSTTILQMSAQIRRGEMPAPRVDKQFWTWRKRAELLAQVFERAANDPLHTLLGV